MVQPGGDQSVRGAHKVSVLGPNPLQGMLFPEMEIYPKVRGRGVRGRGRMGVEVSDKSICALSMVMSTCGPWLDHLSWKQTGCRQS
jgi:hypothetical protein